METISGEVVVDWCNFTKKEVTVGEKVKVVIITDGDVGNESSITVFGLVESVILEMVAYSKIYQRVRIHFAGGPKLEVFNMTDLKRPNHFPCNLTY